MLSTVDDAHVAKSKFNEDLGDVMKPNVPIVITFTKLIKVIVWIYCPVHCQLYLCS